MRMRFSAIAVVCLSLWGTAAFPEARPPAAVSTDIVVQAGHSGSMIRSAATHRGASWYATGGQDGTVKFVHQDGTVLRTIQVCDYWIYKLVFLSHGQLAASCGDHKVYLIDTKDGQIVQKLSLQATAKFLAATADGAIVIAGAKNTVTAWDVQQDVVHWLHDVPGQIRSLVIAQQTETAIIATSRMDMSTHIETSSVDLFSIRSGVHLQKFGFEGRVNRVVTSPNAVYVVAQGAKLMPQTQPGVHSYRSKTKVLKPTQHWIEEPIQSVLEVNLAGHIKASTRQGIRYLDVVSGQLLNASDWHPDSDVSSFPISLPLSRFGKSPFQPFESHLTGQSYSQAQLANRVDSLSWSKAGFLALGMEDGQVQIWNPKSGVPIQSVNVHNGPIHSVRFIENGTKIISGGYDDAVIEYEFRSKELSELWRVKPIDPRITENYEWESILYSAREDVVPIKRPRAPAGFNGNSDDLYRLAISEDERYVLASGMGVAQLIDRVSGSTKPIFGDEDLGIREVVGASFSPDNTTVAVLFDNAVYVIDLQSGSLVKKFDAAYGHRALLFADGDPPYLFVAGTAGEIVGWDTREWKKLTIVHEPAVARLAYWRAANSLILAGPSPHIELLEIGGGLKQTLVGHTSSVKSLAMHPEEPILVSGGSDGSVVFWNLQTRESLATLAASSISDWVVADANGFFDGPTKSWQRVRFRVAGRIFSPEQLAQQYWEPGLLQQVLASKTSFSNVLQSRGDSDRVSDVSELLESIPPRIELSHVPSTDLRNQSVKVEIADEGSGATDLRVFRNGTLVYKQDGPLPSSMDVDVVMLAGTNEITAYAFSSEGVRTAVRSLSLEGPTTSPVTPTFRVLAVGIDAYEQKPLEFAVADADAVVAGFYKHHPEGHKWQQVTLPNEKATRDSIRDHLKLLAQVSQPEDVVVFFFSGHGVRLENRLHLLPVNYVLSTDDGAEPYTIADHDLQEWIEPIKAFRILLVLDACHAGQALESDDSRWGPINSRGLGQLAFEKGIYVLAASQGYQSALENSELGHGFLTYAFIKEGLEQMLGDVLPSDGNLFAEELLSFVGPRVQELQVDKARRKDIFELPDPDTNRSWLQVPKVYYPPEFQQTPLLLRSTDSP